MPIAFAHIKIQPLLTDSITGKPQYLITSDEGKVCVDITTSFLVQFSHIGYKPLSDTISSSGLLKLYPKKNAFTLNDAVVTAQHSPTNTSNAVQRVKVIGREQIDSKAANNLHELLNSEMNIRLNTDLVLGTNIEMMGMGGDKVKILIDGVPVVGRLGGNIDLSQINLNNVERIEIVEGPLSVSYGNDALAGTINLITKKVPAKNSFSAYAESYYETVGQYNVSGGAGYKKKNFSVATSGGRNYFDGFKGQIIGRGFQWDPKEQKFGELKVNHSIKDWKLGLSSDLFDEKITNRGNVQIGYDDSGRHQYGNDDYYKTLRFSSNLTVNKLFKSKYQFNFLGAYNFYRRRKNTYRKNLETLNQQLVQDNSLQDTTVFDLITSRSTVQGKALKNKLSWEVGYDIKLERGEGKRIENKEKKIGDYALFTTTEINVLPALLARVGIRFTHNTGYTAPFTPSLDVKYKINENLQWRGSYGRGFRAPNLKDLYFDFVDINHNIKGNTNLKAETSHSFTTSLSFQKPYKKSIIKAEINAYYNDVKDEIYLAQVDTVTGLFQNVNRGEARTLGTQLNTEYRSDKWKLALGGSLMGIYNPESKENSIADKYSYSPEAQFLATYRFKESGVNISIYYKYIGERLDFRLGANNELIKRTSEAYGMGDVTVSKSFLKKHVFVSTGVKNVFDVTDVRSTSGGGGHTVSNSSSSISWGRTAFVKLKVTL